VKKKPMSGKLLAEVINKCWRISEDNCKGHPEKVTRLFLWLVDKALADISPSEVRKALFEFYEDMKYEKEPTFRKT
jgi:hypothetical protein